VGGLVSGGATTAALPMAAGSAISSLIGGSLGKSEKTSGEDEIVRTRGSSHLKVVHNRLSEPSAYRSSLPKAELFALTLEAARSGELADLQSILLGEPQLLEERASSGFTLLGVATHSGQSSVVAYLIECDADVNRTDFSQRTPLAWAAATGHSGCVRLLCDAGAAVDRANQSGITPLMRAAMSGDIDCAVILCSHGASRFLKSQFGCTAADYAARHGDQVLCNWLTEGGRREAAATTEPLLHAAATQLQSIESEAPASLVHPPLTVQLSAGVADEFSTVQRHVRDSFVRRAQQLSALPASREKAPAAARDRPTVALTVSAAAWWPELPPDTFPTAWLAYRRSKAQNR